MDTNTTDPATTTNVAIISDPAEAARIEAKREAEMDARLIAIGGKLTTEKLALQIAATECIRGTYQIAAVRLGIMLEAKFRAVNAERETPISFNAFCSSSGFPKGRTDTLRTYRWLAKRFLRSLTMPATPITARNTLIAAAQNLRGSETDLVALAEGAEATASIHEFVAGRTLKELITDLTAAEKSAAREECYDGLNPAVPEPEEAAEPVGDAGDDAAIDAAAEPETEQLTFETIFRDADAQTEDCIGFLLGHKEEISPKRLAKSLNDLAELFEKKAAKARDLARKASGIAKSAPELD